MVSRRDYLHACSAGALGALAGCTDVPFLGGDGDSEPAIVESQNVHHRAGFGAAIATADDVLVVGAPKALTRAYTFGGTAFVYERENGSWVKQARLRPPGEDLAGPDEDHAQLSFGSYVAVHDGTVVVGTTSNAAAYTYQRSGSGWRREQRVSPDVEAVADEQRYPNEVAVESARCRSLSFDGETLVLAVGARLAEAPGTVEAVHVFERREHDWQEVAAFAREAPAEFDHYGYVTAVDDGTLVVGGTAGGEGDGAFRSVLDSFERADDGWRKDGNSARRRPSVPVASRTPASFSTGTRSSSAASTRAMSARVPPSSSGVRAASGSDRRCSHRTFQGRSTTSVRNWRSTGRRWSSALRARPWTRTSTGPRSGTNATASSGT